MVIDVVTLLRLNGISTVNTRNTCMFLVEKNTVPRKVALYAPPIFIQGFIKLQLLKVLFDMTSTVTASTDNYVRHYYRTHTHT